MIAGEGKTGCRDQWTETLGVGWVVQGWDESKQAGCWLDGGEEEDDGGGGGIS